MYAYADQNFLIACAGNAEWRRVVTRARNENVATLVLSPFHFYEFGNVNTTEHREQLLALTDDVRPAWLLDRADIQLREFLKTWMEIWTGYFPPFRAIGTLADSAAALHRVHPSRIVGLTIRDYVKAFTPDQMEGILLDSIKENCLAATLNREHFKAGHFNASIWQSIEKQYVAENLALGKGLIEPAQVRDKAREILNEQPITTMIDCFVYWGCMNLLKTYQVESALSKHFYPGSAKLNTNRFVDNQHAIVALAHCDILVTDDKELRKKCERIRSDVKFGLARVLAGGEFIKLLPGCS